MNKREIESFVTEKFLQQRGLSVHKQLPASNFIDWAIVGAMEAEKQIIEKALEAFCETYSKDCIQCKLAKQVDFGCRNTCPAFEQFKDLIND